MACPSTSLGRPLGNSTSPKIEIGAFLDICCPFSKRLYDRVAKEVLPHYEAKEETKGKITFIAYHYAQPWHPQGTMMAEACIAVNEIDPDRYHSFVSTLFQQYTERFTDEKTFEKSKKQIFEEIISIYANLVGVDKSSVNKLQTLLFEDHDAVLVPILKFYTRFGRQNGIHVTPTVLCNRLIANNISSGWSLEQWTEFLDDMLAKDLPKHQ